MGGERKRKQIERKGGETREIGREGKVHEPSREKSVNHQDQDRKGGGKRMGEEEDAETFIQTFSPSFPAFFFPLSSSYPSLFVSTLRSFRSSSLRPIP